MDEKTEQALREDGDGYFTRNYAGIGTIADPVFDYLNLVHTISPITSVLEVGCTNGFRLDKARLAFHASCAGLEVSPAAVREAKSRFPLVDVRAGLAPRDLTFWDGETFDVIIVGHLLYLLPREELFSLAARVDSLLATDGHLVVMDFLSPVPQQSAYAHQSVLQVFKHDPSAPWTWSPTYELVARKVYEIAEPRTSAGNPRAWQTVDLVRKVAATTAYPATNPEPSIHDE
jgi:SAM-dependent methyltransferase